MNDAIVVHMLNNCIILPGEGWGDYRRFGHVSGIVCLQVVLAVLAALEMFFRKVRLGFSVRHDARHMDS